MNKLETTHAIYKEITESLIQKKLSIATMESCTSGLLASFISDTEGSSAVLSGSLITYGNESKIQMGVDKSVIEKYGVYSLETAIQMALALNKIFPSDFCIGVAGSLCNSDPNNADSIPGEVYYCIFYKEEYYCEKLVLEESNRFNAKLEVLEHVGKKLLTLL